MKKVCILLTVLAMLSSMFIAVSASSDIVLLPSDVDYQTGVKMTADAITKIKVGSRFGFEGVDLTGMKSITIEGACPYTGRNNEILQVRVGSPDNGGTVIAYVRMDDDTKSSFTADIETPVTGVQNLYLVGQFSGAGSEGYTKVTKVILSKEPSGNKAYEPIPDSAIIDNYHDTWVAVDGMGRAVADYEEVGGVKEGEREIGMFYWNWFPRQDLNARIPWKINAEFPDAYADYDHPAWDTKGKYYWNEPIFGYYDNLDYWVYRKQAILLANADVDVIFYDGTNQANVWYAGSKVHFEAWRDARASGVDAPGISWITSWKTDRTMALKYIYQEYFREGRYSDLWYYRDGKPMIITDWNLATRYEYPEDSIDRDITKEAFDFFSLYRTSSGNGGNDIVQGNNLAWLDTYPQVRYGQDENGRVQFVALGLARNQSYVWGPGTVGVFSDPYTTGRSYTQAFGEDWREGTYRENYFFLEQASRVLDVDPAFCFVDGWNEWTAGRQMLYSGVENSFVDTYDNEGSRDFEPTRGELKDDSYCQLIDFVRKYQGVRPAPVASAEKTIDINGDIAQWNDVAPEFINDNTDFERDSEGFFNHETGERYHYTTTVKNSISRAKVARDSENFYFMAKTTRPIVTGTANWMNLYINADRNYATGFEGYDYVVNFNGAGVISKFADKAYSVTDIGNVSYKVTGDTLVIAVPRALIGETGKADLEFKWTDSVDCKGDIVEFYNGGSVAPMGRFNFLYTETAQVALSAAEKAAFDDGAMIGAGKGKMIADGGKMRVYEPDTRFVPVMENGVLYYPAEALEDILGNGETKMVYDAEDKILHISTHKLNENSEICDYYWIYSEVDSIDGRINGYYKALTNPVKLINGIPYVPHTYLADCLNWQVYDAGDGFFAMSRTGLSAEMIQGAKAHLN